MPAKQHARTQSEDFGDLTQRQMPAVRPVPPAPPLQTYTIPVGFQQANASPHSSIASLGAVSPIQPDEQGASGVALSFQPARLQREHAFVARDAAQVPFTVGELLRERTQEYTTTRLLTSRHMFHRAMPRANMSGGVGECTICGVSSDRFRICSGRPAQMLLGVEDVDFSSEPVAWILTQHVWDKPTEQRRDTHCRHCGISHNLLKYHRCPGGHEGVQARRARSEDAAQSDVIANN